MLTRTVVQRAAPWARLKCVPTHHVLRLRAVQRRLVAGFASDSNPEIGAQAGGEQCSTSAPSDFSADLAYLMAASRLEEVLAEARQVEDTVKLSRQRIPRARLARKQHIRL